MEERNLLEKMERVQAPPGFERRVLAELTVRKEKNRRRQRSFSFSFAGAAAALLVGFLVLNVFFLERKSPAVVSDLKKEASSPLIREGKLLGKSKSPVSVESVSLIESVDYSSEVRSASSRPQTIYLLEQVTEAANTQIKY